MDDKLLLSLSWNLPLNIQQEAIYKIASIIDLDPKELLQPGDKEYWENAAKVLLQMGYPRVKEAIPGLLVWLQDINWPGSRIVMKLLETVPKDEFILYLEEAVEKALDENDEMWIENLAYFLEQLDLKDNNFRSKKVYVALLACRDFWS